MLRSCPEAHLIGFDPVVFAGETEHQIIRSLKRGYEYAKMISKDYLQVPEVK